MPATLTQNSYGKSDVRLTKVIRTGAPHELFEFSVDIQLFGEFARSYTHGDNTSVVATDSMKNTVYVLAKENQFDSAEQFAVLLAEHFVRTYQHVASSRVNVRQTNWARVSVDGQPHDHAFVCGGPDLRTATASARKSGPTTVTGGVTDLLILKTARSAFKDFVSDRYRTLKDSDDRIFATKLSATWTFDASVADFSSARNLIETAMLKVFATQMSYAVQETMYQMGQAALDVAPGVKVIALQMPNKHRIPVNLQPFGLENSNDIFVWTDEPYGDISATVERAK